MSLARMLCAMATGRGGVLPGVTLEAARTALAQVDGSIGLGKAEGGVRVFSATVCLPVHAGKAWGLQAGEPRPLTGQEEDAVRDDLGIAELERQSTLSWVLPSPGMIAYLRLRDRDLHALHLLTDSGQASIAGKALFQGLGAGVRVQRWGVPLELSKSTPATEEWTQDGPWPWLVDALAWSLHDFVPIRFRARFRLLLRGLLANALAHRSLLPLLADDPVEISTGAGEMRITSPGPLVRRVRLVDGKLQGRWPRNPLLQSLLTGTLGRPGCQDLVQEAKLLGLRLRWTAGDEVSAHLVPDAELARIHLQRDSRPASQRQRAILTALQAHGESTRRELEHHTGIDRRTTISKDLKELCEDGLVERTDEGVSSPRQAYRLSAAGWRHLDLT